MSRLIDADELLEEMRDWGATPNDFKIVRKIIGDIPTAYDVDKVVEQLEENENNRDFGVSMLSSQVYILLSEAIEIVKKGGVDNGKINKYR